MLLLVLFRYTWRDAALARKKAPRSPDDDGTALPTLTLMDAVDQTTPFQIDALLAEVGELRSEVKKVQQAGRRPRPKVVHFREIL